MPSWGSTIPQLPPPQPRRYSPRSLGKCGGEHRKSQNSKREKPAPPLNEIGLKSSRPRASRPLGQHGRNEPLARSARRRSSAFRDHSLNFTQRQPLAVLGTLDDCFAGFVGRLRSKQIKTADWHIQ